jgi:outer membrane protein assembly factor BamA
MNKFLLFLMLSANGLILAQKPYTLTFTNETYKTVKKNLPKNFKDSSSLLNYIKVFRSFAIKKGYLLASYDSLYFANKTAHVSFYAGPKFKKAKLNIPEKQLYFLKRKGNLSEKLLRNVDFYPAEISRIMNDILAVYENNGYPFCRVKLNQINISDDALEATIDINANQQYKITKINLPGEPDVSEKFLFSYIQIKPGDLFNQEKVAKISSVIKQISFIEEIKAPELLFTEDGVELFLYLKSRPVSLINGVVGLQPNSAQQNKINLTGELRLKLVNSLRKAELFDLNWRSIQAQTQSMKIQTTLPNLFQTSFGLDGQFNLYKRDSTFLELNLTTGVQFAMANGNFLKAFYRRSSSNVLGSGLNNPEFSNLKNVETNAYGLAFYKQTIDYLPNPRKGFSVLLEASAGIRTAKDTLKTIKETTSKYELQFQYYIPLAKRHVLKLANYTQIYLAPIYFENEVYRFGGQISLRGFNEEELYATSRSVFTLEYRFLLDRNSFVFAFFDQAWYENRSKTFKTDHPLGFGAGFTFGTNIGNFAISYALGKQLNQSIIIRDGKVHFGYIAYF